MAFQREKQSVSASELLQAIADRQDIQLSQCTITGLLDVNRLFHPEEKFQADELQMQENKSCKTLTLPQPLVFDKCIFEENAVFACPWSQPDTVAVRFESDVIFNSSTFKAQARFRNAEFCGITGFDGCTFNGVVTFKGAVFRKDAKFRTAAFNGYCLLGGADFGASARFTNSHFAKGANFSGVKFRGGTDFDGVYSSSRAVPAYEAVSFGRRRYGEDESFWRFIKQSAQEAGYYQRAGECFYNERCARLRGKLYGPNYEQLSLPRRMLRRFYSIRLLPELVFGRFLFGYGERPVRVLAAGALIVLVCAAFYAQPGALVYRHGDAEPSLLQGLYFSTITFTTLGYGDLYPSPEGFCRFLSMAEAVAGGCLMALFVVCLAKRFSRG